MLDLIVKDGLFFDGLGSAPLRRDIGIEDGKIRLIAEEIAEPARETIDASGLWVCPGFIDIHTHYDIEVEIAPALSESVRHGVTSIVMGNCSLSLTLGDPATLADIFLRVENIPRVLVRKWMKRSVTWKTPREYFRHLEELDLGPNVAAMLGHSALRAQAMGLERSLKEKAAPDDLRRMEQLANEAFDAGCIGLSFDMVPWHMMSGAFKGRTIPSQHADFREYQFLANLCRERDLVLQVSPNPQNLMSIPWILWMSLFPLFKRPLKITVLAALDPVGIPWAWRLFRPALFLLNRVFGCDIRFQTLTEPFQVFSDGPLTPLFEEFPAGRELNDLETREERQALWKKPGFRERFKTQWLHGARRTFHRRLDLMKVVRAPAPAAFTDIDSFMDLLERHDTGLRWESTGANGRLGPRLALMADENILPGFTDAGAHVRNLGYYDGALSLLKQAVATGFMTPQAAIRRVTGEPARWFGLDTGVLKEGKKADFVLIDPEALSAPISEQVELEDPILDGALRMVKRGASAVRGVHIAGRGTVLRAQPALRHFERNRISDEIPEHPFTDYWDIFVLKHKNPVNVALHCLGVVWFYGFLAAAGRNPWFLAALPGSQLIGLVGHYFFERSYIDKQDAVFSLRASWCLNKMFVRVLIGAYGRDIRERLARLRPEKPKQREAVLA